MGKAYLPYMRVWPEKDAPQELRTWAAVKRTEAFQMSFRNMEARLEEEISRLLLSMAFPMVSLKPTISHRNLKSTQCMTFDQVSENRKERSEAEDNSREI